jgi:hypothetical protein
MLYRLSFLLLFFAGCATNHQINIDDIFVVKDKNNSSNIKNRYMSFTQEYYENPNYPIRRYCDDKRAILSDDKFSTETYLKVTNERTKQNRVGKYPIWFLVNDDARGIECIRKSANFINPEPFVVNNNDKLTLKILQINHEEKRVPIKELNVLINMISLVVPQTANFLMRSSNIINDPITRRYLDTMENAFKNGDLDGTKSRNFTPQTKLIKIKLSVPLKKLKRRNLGYIILKPKYRTTLSTVDIINGVPNFKYIFTSSDPRIEDITNYRLKSKNITVKQEIDNFSHLADEYVIEGLSDFNIHLLNRFTNYDRSLILSLALRETNLYRRFSQALRDNNIAEIRRYFDILKDKNNPLHDLSKLLNITGIEYYRLMYRANKILKEEEKRTQEKKQEQERKKQEEIKRQIELQGIENFLRPVAKWSYIPKMFAPNPKIIDTENRVYTIEDLQKEYNRRDNVIAYGCYTNLQNNIHGVSIQDYLIHPIYTDGIKYNYMALSLDTNRTVSVFFYKFNSNNNLKITNILIDKDGYFIMKNRLREVLSTSGAKMCYREILSALE